MKQCLNIFVLLWGFAIIGLKAQTNVTSIQEDVNLPITINESLKDTLQVIDQYLKRADELKNKGQYANAYEDLWQAMLLAEGKGDAKLLASIHNELGVLYGIYGKKEKAIEHKKMALEYVKRINKDTRRKYGNMVSAYFNLAVQYRKANDYETSLVYLDSCTVVGETKLKQKGDNPFVLSERGIILLLQNELDGAEPLLLKSKELFEKGNKNYLVIVYSFLGDLYASKMQVNQAIYYYEKSLNSMFLFNAHTDFKTDVLKKVAALYKKKGLLPKAYFYLEESTKISDSLFSMRNQSNSKLFEIKNRYEEAIVKKDAHIREQQQVIESKKKVQSQLIMVLAFIFLGLISFLLFLYYKSKIRKLQLEKEHTEVQIKHDKEKLNVILETKSKELTVSALQLIEKDKNIEKLLEILKLNASDKYREIQNEIVRGNKDLWDDFNLRFTEVNTDFYKRLTNKHKTLTPTEQKHCALIKLKFDSKEMARLLNISVNSVHISRHRIRKKIGLTREEDLSNYIANI